MKSIYLTFLFNSAER